MPNEIIDKYTSVVHRIKMICFIDTHIVILFHFIYTYCIWDNRFPQKGYSTSVNVSIETIVRSFCARRDPLLSLRCVASHRSIIISISLVVLVAMLGVLTPNSTRSSTFMHTNNYDFIPDSKILRRRTRIAQKKKKKHCRQNQIKSKENLRLPTHIAGRAHFESIFEILNKRCLGPSRMSVHYLRRAPTRICKNQ